MKNPYEQATKVDRVINSILSEHLINPENATEWLIFTRTIKSSLDIIEYKALTVNKTLDKKDDWQTSQFQNGAYLYSAKSNDYTLYQRRLKKYLNEPGYHLEAFYGGNCIYNSLEDEDDGHLPRDINVHGQRRDKIRDIWKKKVERNKK